MYSCCDVVLAAICNDNRRGTSRGGKKQFRIPHSLGPASMNVAVDVMTLSGLAVRSAKKCYLRLFIPLFSTKQKARMMPSFRYMTPSSVSVKA